MKKLWLLSFVFLAACNPPRPLAEKEAPLGSDEPRMVRVGDAESCIKQETISTLQDIVYGHFGEGQYSRWPEQQVSDFKLGLVTGLELVTLSGIDQATGRVNCSGTFFVEWEDVGAKSTISYSVERALDSNGHVLKVYNVEGPTAALSAVATQYFNRVILPINRSIEARENEAKQLAKSEGIWRDGARICQNYTENGPTPNYRYEAGQWLEWEVRPESAEQRATLGCVHRIVREGVARNRLQDEEELKVFEEQTRPRPLN